MRDAGETNRPAGSSKSSGLAGTHQTASTTLVGAGGTLVAPRRPVAGPVLQGARRHGDLGGIGSRGGIEQTTARTVDFRRERRSPYTRPGEGLQGLNLVANDRAIVKNL
jgi:hypothetical protein